MVQEKFETGMYIIDQNFQMININDTMRKLYPSVKVGDICYKALAMQECQCPVCPLLTDDALFYNQVTKEWVSSNAAIIDYPGHGICYNVQFRIRQNVSSASQENLQEDNMDEHIIELSGGSLDTCAIGGYCEPGSPLAYVNEKMLRFLGYGDIEEMSQAVDGLVINTIHPDDMAHVTKDLTQCAQNGGFFETTYRMHCKDRSWLWVVARGKRVQTASGVYVLLCVINEMNEFVQQQNELMQQHEALLRQEIAIKEAMSYIPSGYHRCGVGEGYPFLFVSKSFEQLVGYTWDQLREELDNKFINLVIPEDLPRFANMEAELADHGNGNAAYRIRRRDGQIRWVQDATMTIQWEDEPCFQCTIADITNFVEQQIQFTQQKTEFDLIAENIPCGYHRCSVDNGFRLEFVSSSFMNTIGYERDELLGQPFLDFVVPEDRPLFMSHEPILIRDGKVELVYRIRRKDGSIRWLKDSTMRIQYNGKDSYQCILADITEHVVGLNEAREEAEASNQAKSTFLFNASHDIRTPMNAIQGFSYIIKQNAHNPELVKATVDKLQRSSQVLLTLLNEVLELSRIEQGKDSVSLRPLNMQTHVEKLYEMMQQEMEQSGIRLQVDNHLQHPYVLGDDLKLTRIAMNFLSNARKFTPQGGTVTFGVRESDFDGEKAVYTLYVQDTGIGMSKEFQEHAFEQFERERTSTASGVSGSGLGLSITKKLADLIGGDCFIESELGKGTRISCRVPLALASEDDSLPQTALTIADFSGMRLLLVEDNDFNREIARFVFEGVGFQVEEAVNGVDCLDKLTNAPASHFDFILMDIQMPVMDGYMATKEIRHFSNPAISQIPIIAMTANAFDEDRKRCLEVGMDGHIAKPLDAKMVLTELTRVMSKGDIDE